jgi:heavy metal sensor kinase
MNAPVFRTVRADGRTWRVIAVRGLGFELQIGTDMADVQAELRRFLAAYAFAVPLCLLLLASGGWLLAKQALHPVHELTHVAANITAKGLDQRVQAHDADEEFTALIEVINGMLNRLDVSFRQAARFSADAAHELKTPLTILQGQLNQALRSAPAGSDEQRTYADLLNEVQRLKTIVRKLLLLAQSDSGQLHVSLGVVSLNQELNALFEDLPLLAPGLTLKQDLEPNVDVRADPDLLRQVLQNVITNAVKYNRKDGVVACTLRRADGWAQLSVANTTAAETPFDRDRLFDRFYRGDAAHNRNIDGTGLGLSLAREISRAHGGDLVVEEAREGWISFRLSLPLENGEKKDAPAAKTV